MMEALGSVDDLDAIMEAANALVSAKRGNATSAPVSMDEGSSEKSELAHAKLAGDVPESSDEPAEAMENNVDKSLLASAYQSFSLGSEPIVTSRPKPKGNRRGRIPYLFFITGFGIWAVSLLTIYLPISGWVTPVYSTVVDNNTMTAFLGSTALSFLSSLMIGLYNLRK